ncbi:MAG: threonylcarbamoyl-AMP synthase [Pirellulales bacterium]|nr:threonylcarbamoyl-AMP synthase [Pirellulales bacterium]
MSETQVRQVDPIAPEPGEIAQAAAIVERGGLVAFPTETVYGLGADATAADAVARIFAAKGRPDANPLIVHVLDASGARQLVAEWPSRAERLAQAFWPGPLTLVLPKNDRIPAVVTAGGSTVGLRCPTHPVARALLAAARCPIAAPSANLSNRLSATRAEHVLNQLAGRVDLILDGGATPGGLESTVVDLTTTPPRVLRPGSILAEEIAAVLGEPVAAAGAAPNVSQPLRSPGQLARHYAPRTPLVCIAGSGQSAVHADSAAGRRVGWLPWQATPVEAPEHCVVRSLPTDPRGYAAGLYAALHELDDAEVSTIYVELPPDEPAWAAVRDRLTRAAAKP